ncbi:Uncharacterized protein Fot_06078 [Forsythia ovata]|uniref:Uncharacterized protein n=1 Tax=Forsythia ovata TaxID=205694 RepID=A0ABD1WS20_9LAMI
MPESNASSLRRITFSIPTKDAKTKDTTKMKACKTDSTKKLKKISKEKHPFHMYFRLRNVSWVGVSSVLSQISSVVIRRTNFGTPMHSDHGGEDSKAVGSQEA